jgi:hypothetical protein
MMATTVIIGSSLATDGKRSPRLFVFCPSGAMGS